MALRRGDKVWVEDRDEAWVEGEVLDFRDKLVLVQTTSGKKVTALFGLSDVVFGTALSCACFGTVLCSSPPLRGS